VHSGHSNTCATSRRAQGRRKSGESHGQQSADVFVVWVAQVARARSGTLVEQRQHRVARTDMVARPTISQGQALAHTAYDTYLVCHLDCGGVLVCGKAVPLSRGKVHV